MAGEITPGPSWRPRVLEEEGPRPALPQEPLEPFGSAWAAHSRVLVLPRGSDWECPQFLLLCVRQSVSPSPFLQYVPEDLLPVYKEKVVPVADIITPNQFEAE